MQYDKGSTEQPVMMQDGTESGSLKAGCNMDIVGRQLEAAVHYGILGPEAFLFLN